MNGIIYIITSDSTPMVYIGKTTKTLNERWIRHKRHAKAALEHKHDPLARNEFYENMCNKRFYDTIVELGIDTFRIQELETVAIDQLDEREKYYIQRYNSIAPNGFNLQTGGMKGTKHNESTIQLITKTKLSVLDDNRHDILEGMPPRVSYGENPAKGGKWFLIQQHPLCKYKQFLFDDYGGLEGAKRATIEFLHNLEKAGVQYVTPKTDPILKDFPGLKTTKKGVRLEKYDGGLLFRAGFEANISEDPLERYQLNRDRAIHFYRETLIPKLNELKNATTPEIKEQIKNRLISESRVGFTIKPTDRESEAGKSQVVIHGHKKPKGKKQTRVNKTNKKYRTIETAPLINTNVINTDNINNTPNNILTTTDNKIIVNATSVTNTNIDDNNVTILPTIDNTKI